LHLNEELHAQLNKLRAENEKLLLCNCNLEETIQLLETHKQQALNEYREKNDELSIKCQNLSQRIETQEEKTQALNLALYNNLAKIQELEEKYYDKAQECERLTKDIDAREK
jgi:hypothetical protein